MLAAGSRVSAFVSDHGHVPDPGPAAPTVPADPTPPPEGPPPTAGPGPAAKRRGGRNSRSVADMIRSLVVVGGVVLVLVLIVPRPSAVSQPPVDVPGTAQGAQPDAHFTLEVPQGLPDSWKATSVQLLDSTDGIQTWHVGYETADAQYAAVQQAKGATTHWVSANSDGGTAVGTQVVDGVTWVQFLHSNRLARSLVLAQGDVTTMVTGTASWAELGQLAGSLRPLS
jgi:hypothetical protein